MWSRTGGADSDRFTLCPAGVLALAAAGGYEQPSDANGECRPATSLRAAIVRRFNAGQVILWLKCSPVSWEE